MRAQRESEEELGHVVIVAVVKMEQCWHYPPSAAPVQSHLHHQRNKGEEREDWYKSELVRGVQTREVKESV